MVVMENRNVSSLSKKPPSHLESFDKYSTGKISYLHMYFVPELAPKVDRRVLGGQRSISGAIS